MNEKEALLSIQNLINTECRNVAELLISKNERYGNSAVEPVRIFSSSDPIEQINVRIDDKLSRIKNQKLKGVDDEDPELDLIGYLILKRVAKKYYKDMV